MRDARVAQVCADASKSYGFLHRLDRFTSGPGGMEERLLVVTGSSSSQGLEFRIKAEEEPCSHRSLGSRRKHDAKPDTQSNLRLSTV